MEVGALLQALFRAFLGGWFWAREVPPATPDGCSVSDEGQEGVAPFSCRWGSAEGAQADLLNTLGPAVGPDVGGLFLRPSEGRSLN